MTNARGTSDLLVGREDDTARLLRALDEALAGEFRLILIEGEAGIGKSRLLLWFRDLCVGRGVAVAAGAATDLERQQRPLGPLIDALELDPESAHATSRDVARLLVAINGADRASEPVADILLLPSADTRRRLLSAIPRLVADRAAEGPTAILLDDLQWADTDTVAVLHALVQRHPPAGLLVICAYRPSPPADWRATLAETAPRGSVLEIRLGPLGVEAVSRLVATVAGGEPGAGLLSAIAGAAGNPFFVRELVAALRDDGRIEARDGRADVVDPGLPPSLRTTVIRRLTGLPDATQRTLRWASVLGSSFAVADVATVTGMTLPDAIETLQPAVDAQFVTGDGPRLSFRHDLVHEAIYADMPNAVRAAYHLHVGRSLAAAGAQPLAVAPHFSRGAHGHEPEAAAWLKRAAEEVELRSPATAVGLLRQALDLSSTLDAARSATLFSLVRALLWSGHWVEAEELARRALERDEGAAIEGALRYVMARALIYRGRTADSVKEARRALAYPLPDHDRARLLADLSIRLPLLGELDEGERVADQAMALAGRQGDGLGVSTARSGLSLIHGLRGQPTRAVELAEAALPRGDGSVSESVEFVQPYFYQAIALVEGDEYERAADVLLRLRRRTDEMGMTWARGLTEGLFADLHFKRGNWREALDAAATWQQITEATGTRVWLVLVHTALMRVAVHRGDLAAALRTATTIESFIAEAGSHHLGMERWWLARAMLDEARGDTSAALAALRDAWRLSEERGTVNARRELGPDLARLAARTGELAFAEAVADAVATTAATAQCASYDAAAMRSAGWAYSDAEQLGHAAALYRDAGRPLESALSWEDAGGFLSTTGQLKAAADAFSRAYMLYEELGANRDGARTVSALRSAGVVRGVRRSRVRPDTGWPSLTATEREVAGLAAQGLTNRQIGERMFISSRTVATHLAHVFAKLGLSSRVELAASAAREDLA